VFVAQGRSVRGINKKGKEFSKMTTNLSDCVQSLSVRGDKSWVVGESTFALYEGGRETQFVNCDDVINSMAVSASGHSALLGGRDSRLRAVRGGGVACQLATQGAVSALGRYSSAGSAGAAAAETFMLGTENGHLGLVQLAEEGESCGLEYLWRSGQEGGGVVNCLTAYDLTKDDVAEVVVGRDDGTVQVFRVQEDGGSGGFELESKRRPGKQASLQFERSVEESVRSVQCGVVNTPGFEEIVLCTYAGNIVSFSTEALDDPEEGDKLGRSKATVDTEGKVKALTAELLQLDKQIEAAKAKLGKANAKAGKAGNGGGGASAIGFQMLQVNVRLMLAPEDGSHLLTFELPVAIDKVLLQSTVPVALLESKQQAPNVVVSKTEGGARRSGSSSNLAGGGGGGSGSGSGSGSGGPPLALQAVFRCTEPCKRLEIRLRTIEGHYGQIKATVVAKLDPKIGQQLTVDVKPLSLHRKLPGAPAGSGDLALSMVKFVGAFSLHQIHDWISSCLPDVPINLPKLDPSDAAETAPASESAGGADAAPTAESEEASPNPNSMGCLWFENTQTLSVLVVRYKEGKCVVESSSVSAIAIMREALSAEANRRKVKVSIRFFIHPDTVPRFLEQMHPRLASHARRGRQVT